MPINQTIKNRLDKLIANIAGDFDVSKLSKSPSRFDPKKLDWFNQNFIQMMCLEEFVLRASRNRFEQRYPDKNLRVGDYVLLVDFEKQMIFGRKIDFKTRTFQYQRAFQLPEIAGQIPTRHIFGTSGFYPVGGGRDEGEDSLTGLKREALEELDGQLEIDGSQLIPFAQLNMAMDSKGFEGLELNLSAYPVSIDQIQNVTETEVNELLNFEWMGLEEVITGSDVINYAFWKEFCETHNLPIFEPNETVLNQYLAYGLDQQRVTLLSQLGLESDCVLNYIPCSVEILTWKKSSQEESISNLKKVYEFIIQDINWNGLDQKIATELGFQIGNSRFQNLKQAFDANQLKEYLKVATAYWEEIIKEFLTAQNMDFGATLWPLRLAMSGREKSPSPFELLAVLDQDQARTRIQAYLN